MAADPFISADPLLRRAASRGVRLQPLASSGPVWRPSWQGHLVAAVIGAGVMFILMQVFG